MEKGQRGGRVGRIAAIQIASRFGRGGETRWMEDGKCVREKLLEGEGRKKGKIKSGGPNSLKKKKGKEK